MNIFNKAWTMTHGIIRIPFKPNANRIIELISFKCREYPFYMIALDCGYGYLSLLSIDVQALREILKKTLFLFDLV